MAALALGPLLAVLLAHCLSMASADRFASATPELTIASHPGNEPRPQTGAARHTAVGAPTRQWDAAALLAAIAAGDNPRDILEWAIASVPERAFCSVLNGLADNPNPVAKELLEGLLRRWITEDRDAVARWSFSLSGDEQQQSTLQTVALVWCDKDLPGAEAWATSLAGSTAASGILTVGYEAARTTPADALRLACLLSATLERDALLVHALSQWAALDASAARVWAEQVPDPALRQRLLETVAVALAEQDGPEAAAMVASVLPAGREQARAAVAVVQRWAQSSPEDTAAWVEEFPANSLRAAAAETLVAVWKDQDPTAAELWLQRLNAADRSPDPEVPANPQPRAHVQN